MTDKNGQVLRDGDYIAVPDWANNYTEQVARVLNTYIPDRAGCIKIYFENSGTELKRASETRKMSVSEVVLWKLENLT